MKRLSLTPKKTAQEKHSTLDSVSASQLLKALHTLENINMIQEQIDDDLNISFSQKDTFSQDGQQDQEMFGNSKTGHNMQSNTKNHTHKNPSQQMNNSSALKKKVLQQVNQNGENMSKNFKTGKMNFEFYMSKKQHTAMGLLKNRSKSPRPSQAQQPKNLTNKSFQKAMSSTANKSKQNMTPRGKGYGHNRTTTTGDKSENRHNSSVSPLTERPINGVNRQVRMKTEANQKEVGSYQKRHTKANSNLVHINREQQFNKTNASHLTTVYKQSSKPTKTSQIQSSALLNTSKKPRQSTNPLYTLSIHERNKQYLRQKNQRLAKLCQQMQQKKRQQQKQCTFKPKILSDNSNIKPKYNDLCVSRQLMEKGHKKCKQGKENVSEQECVIMGEGDSKHIKNTKDGFNKKLMPSNEEFGSRLNEDSMSLQEQRASGTVVKSKYKNSKFNILLDLIH